MLKQRRSKKREGAVLSQDDLMSSPSLILPLNKTHPQIFSHTNCHSHTHTHTHTPKPSLFKPQSNIPLWSPGKMKVRIGRTLGGQRELKPRERHQLA